MFFERSDKMYDIGTKIQEQRTKLGLTQEGLAEKLDVSRQSVSKWEVGSASPDIDKLVALARLFQITTDELLAITETSKRTDYLRLSSVYLITKNMAESINFYEKLLCMRVSTRHPVFAEFFFDSHCIALMDVAKLPEHDSVYKGSHKFVLNFSVTDLVAEQLRIKNLDIGKVGDIKRGHETYYFFNVIDPDGNVCEINGQVYDTRRNDEAVPIVCQSCSMPMNPNQYGTLSNGENTSEYCHYCYKDGDYTTRQTLDEAIEGNIQFWLGRSGNDPDKARTMIRNTFETLNRWKK
jgi:transcriptional regulator with XRE-family HTH domain